MDWNLHQSHIWWEVMAQSTTIQRLDSIEHGPMHWTRVRFNGMRIGRMTQGCDLVVVDLFALFHDAMRDNEKADPAHGERAWDLFCSMSMGRFISSRQEAMLKRACIEHNWGTTTLDPTIGVCWDADRLDLTRSGIDPQVELLSTSLARLEVEVRP